MSKLERIIDHPAYRQLLSERQRLGLSLSAVMAGVYFAYILTVAFRSQALGTPIADGTVVTWGIVIGVGIIALGFALTCFYVICANSRFDALSNRLREDV